MKQKLKYSAFYGLLNVKMFVPDDNVFMNLCPLTNVLKTPSTSPERRGWAWTKEESDSPSL